jgi:hypothetical protein
VAVVDLAFFSAATYLDIIILAILPVLYLGRKRRVLSSIWTFAELQYVQFRGLLNVTILRKDDYKWKKIERIAAPQA